MLLYTCQRLMLEVIMIGDQNFGCAFVPTHNNLLYQVPTLAKPQGVPDSEHYGDSFLVCGRYNHLYGNLCILSEYILWFKLVGRFDLHDFNVSIPVLSLWLHAFPLHFRELRLGNISSRHQVPSLSGLQLSPNTCEQKQNNSNDSQG